MKSKAFFLFFFLFFIVLFSCKSNEEEMVIPEPEIQGILQVSPDGIFMRNNKPFYGMGINYFNAFYRTIQNSSDKSYKEGLKYLGNNKVPFIRFSTNGFWANELKLYQTNKARYFELLDEFVKTAEENNVGLIPSLFWYYISVPDLVGEHANQWANPESKTIAFMRTYTADMVKRYKNSPAIWAWEFGNEMNSYVDFLGQAATDWLPKVSISMGTPAQRTKDDIITTEILCSALHEFAAEVRKYDPDRAIFSGNGMPHQSAYHLHVYKNWTQDSTAEFTKILGEHNPSYIGTVTIHPYPSFESKYFMGINANLSRIIQEAVRSSKELKQPLFVGEFGSPKTLGAEKEAEKFYDLVNAIIDHKVQLSALWVFDFSPQDADWNVTPLNSREYQLHEVIKVNARFREEYGLK